MEMPEGSMSRMAEENKSEEMMAQVSVFQRLFDRISSSPISELLGQLKLDEGLLNTLKTNLQSLDAILDDAESKTYQETDRKSLYLQRHLLGYYEASTDEEEEDEEEDKNENLQRRLHDPKVQWEEEEDKNENLQRRLHDLKVQWEEDKYVNLPQWLHNLKEVGYDLEDLLDKIATERLRQQFEFKPWNIETDLEKIISPDIRDQVEEISSRIALVLRRGKEKLGLSEASRILRKPYPLSAAKGRIEDECQVYGRDEDKEAIIKRLLSDHVTDDIITVLPIVGEDGVGKTTLARLVYNDDRVSKQFDLKGWACLSRNVRFPECLIKAFSEAFSIVDPRNIGVELNKILKMKKFLLVLDDVDHSRDCNRIRTYLLEGAKGSKILLTTQRSWYRVPKWFLTSYHLKPLNSDGSWKLFVKHAFVDKEIGLHPELGAIGKNIVIKCRGLPLLIVTLGAMLRFKPSVEEWEAVSRELSVLEKIVDMIPILGMCYDSLPPNLKRCLAYCSIFPKDHEYDKEKLVLLWMAEGFLQHSKHRRIEEVGHEYFDDLTFRSFFQQSGANSSRFVMHSFMYELARFVSGHFCDRLDDIHAVPRRVRHLSWSVKGGVKSCQKLIRYNPSPLRTLLLYLPPRVRSTDLRALFLEGAKYWQCLRVLSFSCDTITKLPYSVGALKLLQYLDLSHTKINRLPNIATTLYNLQTLLLSYCHLLSKLPKKFRRLVYLRHLDVRETCLKVMPPKMGCLTRLQSLSDFVVGKYSGSNIRELGPLKDLGGTLRISELQNVVSARDASVANLKNKASLKVLELKWSDATANSQHATKVLEKLEPHRDLEELSIISYNGISFPGWVGDPSFSKMEFLRLSDCNNCSHLPLLGQLPSLKQLIIEGMRGVKKIGPEFFGVNDVSANPFPSLEILVFREMPEWEGWIASEMQPLEFPCLKRMCIKSCPKYENHLSLCLPPSLEVDISVSEETSVLPTEETLPKLPFMVEKQLHEGDKVQVKGKQKLQDDTMEIAQGSMSLMAEENLSEERMAQASIFWQLYARISSGYISEFFGELKLDAGLLYNLKRNLLSLDAILDDAESKAYEDKEIKKWFGDLKAVSYDLEDLLDEIASKRVHYQLESKPSSIKASVQRIISPIIGDRFEEINSRITPLLHRGKSALRLKEASRILMDPYPLPAAKDRIEDECQVYGRDEDKEAIVKRLLSDHVLDDIITILPIVGEDGVGKTTIAQLVYNDDRVSKQFDLKGWASLSLTFPFHEGLIKAFSEAFSVVDSRNIRVKLNKILKMKKFLLVLDDVDYSWDQYRGDEIRTYLSKGAKGSKILLATRPSSNLYMMLEWDLFSYCLKPLNSDDSWLLFVKHALADKEIVLHPLLEAIGKKIVTKCRGLPLLIVTLGAMLRFKPSVEEWEAVLRKLSVLNTNEDMIPILGMCYDSLPPNLKRCFAYCSMFPSDHEYDKEKLVLLWMAEGFLQHSKHRRIEEVGHEYFDDLTFRSFFQKSGANSSRFVMHSLMHKLAQSVSGEFCFSFVNDPNDKPSKRVRHLSLSPKSCQELIYCYPSHLRTVLLYYLPAGKISTHLSGLFFKVAKKRGCLRVLSFSHDTITELPDSIGALKLLQYLDISHTKITRLPNIVTTLYNLQTLLLSYCHLLSKLPKKLRRLVNLRHLDIRETCLKEMPGKMGYLTSLQSLSDFVVGEYSSSNIRELGPLKNLGGTLRISRLQNVVSARDAAEANLKNKADLKVLELKWRDATANSQHATNVLEKLEPHRNLEKLSIISYNGISFAGWVGDSSFYKMVFLHLSDCNNCSRLPPLGQLPSLKELIIERMRGVKKIGPEFFGVNDVSANPFPSLEILVFREMPEWEGWIALEMQQEKFPLLKRMCIKSCPKYENHLSLCLPPSVEVDISVSEETSVLPTEETLPKLPFMAEKQLHEGDKVQVRGKEKLQDRTSTAGAGLLEVEELGLPDSPVQVRGKEKLQDRPSTAGAGLLEVEELGLPDSAVQVRGKEKLQDRPSTAGAGLLEVEELGLPDSTVQVRRKEKLQDRPSTAGAGLLEVEELGLPDSIVSQRTDVSITSNRLPPGSLQHLTEVEKRKNMLTMDKVKGSMSPMAEENLSEEKMAQASILQELVRGKPYTDEKQFHEGDKAQLKGKEKLQDRPSTARLPEVEELQLPDSHVMQRTDVSSDTDHSEDSQEDISSPEQESKNVSRSSQLKNLPPTLYSLEIEACDDLPSLPADLNTLNNLQHLYIINCHLLKSIQVSHLPKALKTLYIRKCEEVQFLANAEKHEVLENLCIESSCDSLDSFPLAIFPKLRNLSIWDCAKFNSLSITEDHRFLNVLEIRNCAQFISFPEEELRIPNLTSIRLFNCKNLKVLPGLLHGFTSLQSLIINECPEVESVPEGGLPSSLNLVCISFCHKLIPCIEWGLHKLNDFSRIEVEDGSKDLESFPEQNLLPRNLFSLRISRLPNLKVLDYKGLQHLTSLKILEINSCNKLHCLPDEGLPSSLRYLYISDCPLLNSKLQKRRGKEWIKIAHVPHIQIDGNVIS